MVVRLLERERTDPGDGAPDAAPDGAPATPPADPDVRTCSACGAELEPGQDWCLSCGAAATPLGARPGRRALLSVASLVLLLVAGAVAASVAALSDDRAPGAVASAPATQPPAAVPPAATTPETGTVPEDGAADGETGTLPEVDPPSSSTEDSPRATPVTPSPTSSTPPITPAPIPAPTPTPTPTPSDTGSSTPPASTDSGSTTPSTPAAQEITVEEDAASVYDPYGKATAAGAPGKAVDGDRSTSWFVDAAPGSQQIGIGYAVNLGEARGIRRLEIFTPTPGFRVEVYATDEATPPPNILDSRWAHITDRSKVGLDAEGRPQRPEKIVLGAGSSKYQTLLLWITQPPESGTRVRISELKIFG